MKKIIKINLCVMLICLNTMYANDEEEVIVVKPKYQQIKVLESEFVNSKGKTEIIRAKENDISENKEEIHTENKIISNNGYQKITNTNILNKIENNKKEEPVKQEIDTPKIDNIKEEPIKEEIENIKEEPVKEEIENIKEEPVKEEIENIKEEPKNIISKEKTIKCKNKEIGTEIKINNINYLVVSNETIKDHLGRAEMLCTTNITDMSNLLNGDIEFDTDISSWDTSNVTKMNGMFKDCQYFNQDISNWDVSNVKNMSEMFYGAILFNKNISKWNITENTDVFNMFYNALAFDQNLSIWKKSNLINSEDFLENSAMVSKFEKHPR